MGSANLGCAIFLILCPILEGRINYSLLRGFLWKEFEGGPFEGREDMGKAP
jgi:hypothetical protein